MKQNIKSNIALLTTVAALLSFFCLPSCKKEYIDKFNIIPGDTIRIDGFNHIISFSLKEFSADTLIKASITEKDSIIVYWPFYKNMPSEISPEIVLPAKAKISPSSLTKVPFANGTVYTVTAEDGKQRKYTLKVIPKQPQFRLRYGVDGGVYDKASSLGLIGEGLIGDKARTTVIVESLDKKNTYTLIVESVSAGFISASFPQSVPTGQYKVKVTNGFVTGYVDDGAILTLTSS